MDKAWDKETHSQPNSTDTETNTKPCTKPSSLLSSHTEKENISPSQSKQKGKFSTKKKNQQKMLALFSRPLTHNLFTPFFEENSEYPSVLCSVQMRV